MAFDTAFLDRLRERASIVRYAGRKLAFDQRKSQPAKGDYWACCPFHGEKTASFHVLERRSLYKCFGCQESGDIFKLAMKLDGLSFREAVETIAAEAGVALPEESPREREAQDRRQQLQAVVAAAQSAFEAALKGPDGAAARAYLEKRGLGDPALQAQFGLGWAPDGWTWLNDRLAKKFSSQDLAEAGLIKDTQDGKRKVDMFRARLMFPIHDAQGRVIAFGGRLIQPGEPKYLNSPETPLFSKGRNLYRLQSARALASRTKARGLVVAEGYVDVIAFERAGIPAVAPLGTALTEDQLELVWRSGPEPIMCFDGDSAGQRAAHRALDLALPKLSPLQTLRIAVLPPGQDPDDLFRRGGAEALQAVIAAAIPAVDALFERERAAQPLDTPEAKAGLKERLKAAVGRIGHEETRRQYFSEVLSRADALFRPQRFSPQPQGVTGQRHPARAGGFQGKNGQGRNGKFGFQPPVTASAELKAALARRTSATPRSILEIDGVVRLAVDHPRLLDRGAEAFADLAIADPDLDRIRHATLDLLSSGEKVDREAVSRHLQASGDEGAAARIGGWPAAAWSEGEDQRLVEEAAEAQWSALVSLNLMGPTVGADVAAVRARPDAVCDSDEFARLQAQIGAQRERAAAALKFGDEPVPAESGSEH